jgi:hypothetical protein
MIFWRSHVKASPPCRPVLAAAGGYADELGGNAVLGVRFDSSDIGNGLAEIVALWHCRPSASA